LWSPKRRKRIRRRCARGEFLLREEIFSPETKRRREVADLPLFEEKVLVEEGVSFKVIGNKGKKGSANLKVIKRKLPWSDLKRKKVKVTKSRHRKTFSMERKNSCQNKKDIES